MQQLFRSVTTLGNNYTRLTDQILRERLSVTYAQFMVIDYIDQGSKNASSIAKHLGKTEASISRQIDLLEKKNFIERTVSTEDDRYKILAITKVGEEHVRLCHKVIDMYFEDKLKTTKKTDKLSTQLSNLNQAIESL